MPPHSTDQAQALWFAKEVQPHESALRSYLRFRFSTISDVDDLVQETYMRVLHAKSVGRVREARPYLFVTARNIALDFIRRSKIGSTNGLVENEPSSVVEDRPGEEEAVAHEQKLELLRQAIDALPERCRQVFVLRKLQGLSHQNIAEKLGISKHTVNAHLTFGVLQCRVFLRARGALKGQIP